MRRDINVVTGAFGYSGAHIAARLLQQGERVVTLTGHPQRAHPLRGQVQAYPFMFDQPTALRDLLRRARVVYNTYWVRFDRGAATHATAVANSEALIQAAAEAGVQRFVHVSISNPSADSPLPYFRGKAALEAALARSSLCYGIVRPTVLFGGSDVLINNIAWLLRRLPVFGVAGSGRYPIQPVHVDDLVDIALELGRGSERAAVDAVGPERFEFERLVRLVAAAVGSRARIVHVPACVVTATARLLRPLLRDVLVTRDEMAGLMAGLLVSTRPPVGRRSFGAWLAAHGGELGVRYASELARHYRSSGA